jgi:transcriptional regulator with XRE-family HTH domain
MVMAQARYSPTTVEAAKLLGSRVQLARKRRRWTILQLAERTGVSESTIHKIERGDPSVALGTAFEAAALVGVALFHPDHVRRRLESSRVDDMLAVLPASVRLPTGIDDDF